MKRLERRRTTTIRWGGAVRVLFSLVMLIVMAAAFLPPISFAQEEDNFAPGSVGPEGDFLHARKMYDRGMYDFAASEFELFLKAYPNHEYAGDAALWLAKSLQHQDLIPTARNAYERAAVYLLDSTRAVEAMHRAAEMDLLLCDTSRAIDRYLAVQVLYPDAQTLPRTLLRAAKLQLAIRDWQATERTLNILLRDFPGTEWEFEARLLLAQSYAGQHDLPPAITEAQSVAMHTSSDSLKVTAGLFLGRWELQRLDPKAAEQIWTQVLEGMADVPFASQAALELAKLRFRSGDGGGARLMFERASRMAPDSTQQARVDLAFADLMFREGNNDAARTLYAAADSMGTLLQQGWCLARANKPIQATSAFAGAMASEDHTIQLAATLAAADLSYATDDPTPHLYVQAVNACDELLLKQSIRLHGATTIGVTDPDAALTFLRETEPVSRATTPFDDDLLWLSAGLHARLGAYETAAELFERFASLYPASPHRYDAAERAEFLGEQVIVSGQSDDALIPLLSELAQPDVTPAAKIDLAAMYLHSFKRPQPAMTLLLPLVAGESIPPDVRNRARDLYADALWMEWQQASHGSSAEPLQVSDGLRGRAASLLETWSALYRDDFDSLQTDAKRMWRYNTLQDLTVTVASTLTRQQRNDWSRYLALHPDAGHNDAVRLILADAFTHRLEGDSESELDSLYHTTLDTVLSGDLSSRTTRQALLIAFQQELVADSIAKADSFARRLLEAPDSPEMTEAALYWITQRPSQSEAATAGDWLLNQAPYVPQIEENAPQVIDHLLGTFARDGDPATAQAVVAWIEASDPTQPSFVKPVLAAGDNLLLSALNAEARGDTLNALFDYTAYLAQRTSPMASLRLARLYHQGGKWEYALPMYEQAVRRSPDDPTLQPLRRQLTHWAFRGGEYAKAHEWARTASEHETNPDTAFALDELGVVALYRGGLMDKALPETKAFEGWHKQDPKLDQALARFELEKGRFYSSKQQYNNSLKAYKAVMNKYEDTDQAPWAKYELARDYMDQGEADKAYEMLIELSADVPDHPVMGNVYWLLGNYYASKQNYFDAFNKYEEVLADSAYIDSWPYVLGNQVRAFKDAGFYEGAMRAARKYLELYPDAPDAFDHRMNLALSYHETGHYDLAISQFRRAMTFAEGEDYAACQFYIAEALERDGRLKEAVSEYLRVVHLNRATKLKWGVTALYAAGRVLERLNEPERAKQMYREIVRREGLGSPFGRRADEQVKRLEMFQEERAAVEEGR
ncbi:tetratricopeptide repeat protein [bacterium]|nr:tetratricopeptide repeat protein [bacterium]